MSAYLGQRALTQLIQLYRRHLSGKGPLRRVSCTFHQCESCSAYGLRIAQTAQSLGDAVYQIRSRLRRCGEASLYRSGRDLLWGELYEGLDVEPFEAKLRAANEAPQTIRAALLHGARVAKFQGEHALSLSLARRSTQYPAQGELAVRRGDALLSALWARLWWFLCWPGVVLLVSGVVCASSLSLWWISALGAGLAGIWGAQILARYAKKKAFFTGQMIRLQFIHDAMTPTAKHREQTPAEGT